MSKPYIVLATFKPKEAGLRWNAPQIAYYLTGLTHKLGLLPHDDPAHGPLRLAGKNWSSDAWHAEVRRRTFKTAQAESFHYDGDLEPNSKPDCGIVLWASNTPTEIKWRGVCVHGEAEGECIKHSDCHVRPATSYWKPKSTEIFQPAPYEVVLFHNLSCLHRRPPGAHRIRWVFRQRVSLSAEWRRKLGLHA